MRLKVGDTVVVVAGKNRFTKDKKGNVVPATGKILEVYPKTNRVLVEGINKVKKHQKPTQENQEGGIVEIEAPIHASNVMLLDPKKNVPTRIGYRIEDGKKVRFAKKSGTTLN